MVSPGGGAWALLELTDALLQNMSNCLQVFEGEPRKVLFVDLAAMVFATPGSHTRLVTAPPSVFHCFALNQSADVVSVNNNRMADLQGR